MNSGDLKSGRARDIIQAGADDAGNPEEFGLGAHG